jgi:hypothetical protein
MATKFPAILTPRTFDLRAWQIEIDKIRERLIFADQELALLRRTADNGTVVQSITGLQAQINNLTQQINVLTVNFENLVGTDESNTPVFALASQFAALERRVGVLEQIPLEER